MSKHISDFLSLRCLFVFIRLCAFCAFCAFCTYGVFVKRYENYPNNLIYYTTAKKGFFGKTWSGSLKSSGAERM